MAMVSGAGAVLVVNIWKLVMDTDSPPTGTTE